ncbi:MAG: CvpA family protein [Janthinobacterium lividum]
MQGLLHSTEVALSGMNPLDWIFAITLAVSTVTAFMRGLILSVVSVAGLVFGIFAAAFYSPRIVPYLLRWVGTAALARVAAFLLILLCVYLLAALIGRLLRGAFSAVGLGFLDRLGGAVFGFARGVLLLAALLLPFAPFLQQLKVTKTSLLMPYLLPAAHGISFVLPRNLAHRTSMTDWILPEGAMQRRRSVEPGNAQPED